MTTTTMMTTTGMRTTTMITTAGIVAQAQIRAWCCAEVAMEESGLAARKPRKKKTPAVGGAPAVGGEINPAVGGETKPKKEHKDKHKIKKHYACRASRRAVWTLAVFQTTPFVR